MKSELSCREEKDEVSKKDGMSKKDEFWQKAEKKKMGESFEDENPPKKNKKVNKLNEFIKYKNYIILGVIQEKEENEGKKSGGIEIVKTTKNDPSIPLKRRVSYCLFK